MPTSEAQILSELAPIKAQSVWLMCKPEYFNVSYEINPWMSVGNPPDSQLALEQWCGLKERIEQFGGQVELVNQVSGLPDMVFTANGGLVYNDKVVIPRFVYPERDAESLYFQRWFKERGYQVYWPINYFEGAGDGLFAGNTLLLGYGLRSTFAGLQETADFLKPDSVIFCELRDSRFYHLDTCLTPLNGRELLIYLPAFSKQTQLALRDCFELIEVSHPAACGFACNSVVLGSVILMPAAGASDPKLIAGLADRGYEVIPVEISEFVKAGGAAKCLSLQVA